LEQLGPVVAAHCARSENENVHDVP
jgi:hypothetical protein